MMELKVWVDGVQRIVCGVTEFTTCQEVVIALAQAIGRTGRYTLIEKWRDTERLVAPGERPVVSLNKWGQYASDVQLVLQRTGPSVSERIASEGQGRVPERGLYRQSLPPHSKLRPPGAERSLRRREPKRKSLTFSGARGLREIFSRSRDSDAKQVQQRGVSLSLSRIRGVGGGGVGDLGGVGGVVDLGDGGVTSVPGSPARDLSRLVQLQRDKLQALESRLEDFQDQIQDWEDQDDNQGGSVEEELLLLEQQVRRNEAEEQEEEFWQNELHIEQESERKLRLQLAELQLRVRESEEKLSQYLQHIQSLEGNLEQEKLQQEEEQDQRSSEEEAQVELESVRSEMEMKIQQTEKLERNFRALERSLEESSLKLQEKEVQLELLTKELRQVNLQQFIQQTGSKVTVLPAQTAGEHKNNNNNNRDVDSGSLKRLGSSRLLPNDLRTLQSAVTSSMNPEGIYV